MPKTDFMLRKILRTNPPGDLGNFSFRLWVAFALSSLNKEYFLHYLFVTIQEKQNASCSLNKPLY